MTKPRAENDEKINVGRGENALCLPNTDTLKILGPEDLRDELLPSIPNNIALQVIVPKLSGADVNMLSLVSRNWQEAIHRRWVYDARVSSHSTEAFVVTLHHDRETFRLYSLNGNSMYLLPPIPSREEILCGCECISLDGKIYILGGAIWGSNQLWSESHGQSCPWSLDTSRQVFMLDLAGHQRWKECASMKEGRHHFGSGVLDGKIYVVGGHNNGKPMSKCEVYDPKVDVWSSIADMIPYRIGHRVAALGGELFVYGGKVRAGPRLHHPRYVVAYNPVKNEWRQLGHLNTRDELAKGHTDREKLENPWLHAFVAQGKFHSMFENAIEVYDINTNSWSSLHPSLRRNYKGLDTWALDDEILTEKDFHNDGIPHGPISPARLVRIRRFGIKITEIAFEKIGNSRLRSDLKRMKGSSNVDMCLIHL